MCSVTPEAVRVYRGVNDTVNIIPDKRDPRDLHGPCGTRQTCLKLSRKKYRGRYRTNGVGSRGTDTLFVFRGVARTLWCIGTLQYP
jgi:hypothetical protein